MNRWAGTDGAYTDGQADPLGVCKYDASGKNIDYRPGCTAGYTDFSEYEYPLTKGGAPTDKGTICWPTTGGVPSAVALDIDNYVAQETYTAGEIIDVSWIVDANHGGAVEFAVVCDFDETYDNFKKNRL